jgi:hypothetical protein
MATRTVVSAQLFLTGFSPNDIFWRMEPVVFRAGIT